MGRAVLAADARHDDAAGRNRRHRRLRDRAREIDAAPRRPGPEPVRASPERTAERRGIAARAPDGERLPGELAPARKGRADDRRGELRGARAARNEDGDPAIIDGDARKPAIEGGPG